MMVKKLLLAAAAVALLSACADRWDVEGARNAPNAGGPFEQALQQEYVALAADRRARRNWEETAYFVAKAHAVAAGTMVLPQDPAERRLSEADAAMAAQSRSQLLSQLDASARTRAPAAAARAQVAGYDCWVERMDNGNWPDQVGACKANFDAAMAEVNAAMQPAMPPSQEFTVFFPTGGVRIDAQGMNVLRNVVDAYQANRPATVVVAGHTDSVGSDTNNMLLSQRRAEAVANALATLGISTADMALEAYGQEQLVVPTANNVAEPRNRRVGVMVRGSQR